MHQILVVFENDSSKAVQIANHLSEVAGERGDACSLLAFHDADSADLRAQDAILVVAPVSRARERASVARFVRPRAARLSAMPGAFVSIGPDAQGRHREGVPSGVRDLLGRAGWSPTVIAQIGVGWWPWRVARSARRLVHTAAHLVARRGPRLDIEERPDWGSVDRALARLLDVADETVLTPSTRLHRVARRNVRPT